MKVVITGGARGIGYATVCEFLANLHEVFCIDVLDAPNTSIINRGTKEGMYHHFKVDVSCKNLLPVIDDVAILVTSAGVQTEEGSIPINLIGAINCCERYALQPKIKAVLNVASVSAHNGAEYPLYTASKGGILAYTKWLAQEVAKYGATANSISPGGVVTPMTKDIWEDDEKRAAVLNETLLGHWAVPEEIAKWIYFITVTNKSMTAQDIIIDNGETAKYNFIQ